MSGSAVDSFEEVDALVPGDLSAYEPGGQCYRALQSRATNPGAAMQAVRDLYKTVRPIILFLSGPLPKKWRQALRVFAGVMDTLFPPGVGQDVVDRDKPRPSE